MPPIPSGQFLAQNPPRIMPIILIQRRVRAIARMRREAERRRMLAVRRRQKHLRMRQLVHQRILLDTSIREFRSLNNLRVREMTQRLIGTGCCSQDTRENHIKDYKELYPNHHRIGCFYFHYPVY
ncbi:hypothetical protein LOD99_10376 [Oopsacas minuta]|uniref:Uncharacterized protein n=1 Tax=Oopsacas minuta TaxID=111878 RepID=A0AAV7KIB2_9METZ|nr:hypothetical protein LOD99_10376 [Oopsacas minuta]